VTQILKHKESILYSVTSQYGVRALPVQVTRDNSDQPLLCCVLLCKRSYSTLKVRPHFEGAVASIFRVEISQARNQSESIGVRSVCHPIARLFVADSSLVP
jgi:hypothetical protein